MRLKRAIATGVLVAGLFGGGSSEAQALTAYGISQGMLLKLGENYNFQNHPPVAVTFPEGGDGELLGIDYDGATGLLYVVTDSNRIHRLDPASGVATPVGAAAFADAGSHELAGFEVIPGAGEARVITKQNHNLRVSLESGGLVGTDSPLAYAGNDVNAGAVPVIRGLAYRPDGTLYGIDEDKNTLVRVGGPAGDPSAAGGVLRTVGPLGSEWTDKEAGFPYTMNAEALDGMDVGPDGEIIVAKWANFEMLFSGTTFYTVRAQNGRAVTGHYASMDYVAPGGEYFRFGVRGFAVVPEGGDEDGDGVPDAIDQCPGTPAGAPVDDFGCEIEGAQDLSAVLVSVKDKCNKKGVCKRKVEVRVLKTPGVATKKIDVELVASADSQRSYDDELLKTKRVRLKKAGSGKAKFKVKLPESELNSKWILAQVDGANEVFEVDEYNNGVVVSEP